MKRKLYVFLIIIVIVVCTYTQNILAYQQNTVGSELILDQPLSTLQKQVKDMSNEYVSYNNNMFATIKVTITKKKDDNGAIHYMVGKEENSVEWLMSGDYIFDDNTKNTWTVWLDIQYLIYGDGSKSTYNAYVQNAYFDDTGDFDAEKDGWKGQKNLDSAVNNIGKETEKITQGVTSFFKGIFRILGGLKDLAANLTKNFIGTVLTGALDILKFFADILQIIADSLLGENADYTITYSQEDLYSDSAGEIDKNAGQRDEYTKIAKYSSKEETESSKTNVINIDGKKQGFTEDTPIPVIPGDLYYIALGECELLDINFFDVDNDTDENSVWSSIRKFTRTVIHITFYIAGAFLIIILIWHGIKIVAHAYDSPESRAEHIEGLEKFSKSLLMLIGTVIIMSICIFGSKAIFNTIKLEDSKEGPIRVNVKSAGYSFSTTITGYYRYRAEIEDVDQYLEKAKYTFAYVVLVITNCGVILFMFARMIGMFVLAMLAPIIATMESINIKTAINYESWVKLYFKLSLVQIIMALMYQIILKGVIIK